VIGKSEPARNQGTIAIAGRRAMYSSLRGTRAASVSATPYMATAKSSATATNQSTPDTVGWKWIRRITANAMSTPT
jgi:hypothetical protein